ncbi:MAG: hypothetical protein ACI3ZL_04880 [Candidatus Cryptobacteroides sp.]
MDWRSGYALALAGAFALAGCQEEMPFEASQVNDIVISAVSETGADTKTVLDGVTVLWNSSDRIAVFNGIEMAEFTTTTPDRSASADFTTTDLSFAPAETYLAAYPYSDDLLFADGKVIVTLPAIQTATASSFDPDANITVASGPADALYFRNVCSYLKFTVPYGMTDLTSVELSSNGGETLASMVTVTCSDASSDSPEGSSSVVLEGDFREGETYYMAVLPVTLDKGFTLTMTRSGETSVMTTDKTFTFTRSRSANIGQLYDGTWKVALDGDAVPSGKFITLTRTLENGNVFACHEELQAGHLYLKVLYENLYIAPDGGSFSDGEAMPYHTQDTPAEISIPSDGKYRIVLDRQTSTLTICSPATDVPDKTVLFKRTGGAAGADENCSLTVDRLWILGEKVYYNGSRPKGEPYVLTQSLANPRLFVFKGETLSTDNVKFSVSDNWNNEYAYGCASTRNVVATPSLSEIFTPLSAGQGDNRYALFQIPEGTNYIEVYIGNASTDEDEHALGKVYEPTGSYVRFENRTGDNGDGGVTASGMVKVKPEPDTERILHNPLSGWVTYSGIGSGLKEDFWDLYDNFECADAPDGSGKVKVSDWSDVLYIKAAWSAMNPEDDVYIWEQDPSYSDPARRLHYLVDGAKERGMRIAFTINTNSVDKHENYTPQFVFDAGAQGYETTTGSVTVKSGYPDDPIFQQYYAKFVKALAEKYDNPDEVEFISGLGLGAWGECHTFKYSTGDVTPREDVLDWATSLYAEAFRHVPVFTNYHRWVGCLKGADGTKYDPDSERILQNAIDKGFSMRHDAFGMKHYYMDWERDFIAARKYTVPVLAEGGWVKASHGSSITGDGYADYSEVRRGEYEEAAGACANMMDLRYNSNVQSSETWSWFNEGFDLMQQFLREGVYRLCPSSVTLPLTADSGTSVTVCSQWQNLGRAYCPTNIPQWEGRYAIAYALLNEDCTEAYVFTDSDADISKIVPDSPQAFETVIDLAGVTAGKYIWATAIVNKDKGNRPGIELSVKDSYLVGDGWTKLCNVSVK